MTNGQLSPGVANEVFHFLLPGLTGRQRGPFPLQARLLLCLSLSYTHILSLSLYLLQSKKHANVCQPVVMCYGSYCINWPHIHFSPRFKYPLIIFYLPSHIQRESRVTKITDLADGPLRNNSFSGDTDQWPMASKKWPLAQEKGECNYNSSSDDWPVGAWPGWMALCQWWPVTSDQWPVTSNGWPVTRVQWCWMWRKDTWFHLCLFVKPWALSYLEDGEWPKICFPLGCPRVRASSHLQIGSPGHRWSSWTRNLLHHPLYRHLFQSGPANCFIWCSTSGSKQFTCPFLSHFASLTLLIYCFLSPSLFALLQHPCSGQNRCEWLCCYCRCCSLRNTLALSPCLTRSLPLSRSLLPS